MKLFIGSVIDYKRGKYNSLLSVGLYSEGGQAFYAEFTDYERQGKVEVSRESKETFLFSLPWEGKDNYYIADRDKSNLVGNDLYKSYSVRLQGDTLYVCKELLLWLEQFEEVEIWYDGERSQWDIFKSLIRNREAVSGEDLPMNVLKEPKSLAEQVIASEIDPMKLINTVAGSSRMDDVMKRVLPKLLEQLDERDVLIPNPLAVAVMGLFVYEEIKCK